MSKVPSSAVVVQKRIPYTAIGKLRMLTAEAVARALEKFRSRMTEWATGGDTQVPVDTGRLRDSFSIGVTPSFVVMKWSAVDPRSGYDYALVQDIGRPGMWGKHYSEVATMIAQQIMMECLEEELQAMEVGG